MNISYSKQRNKKRRTIYNINRNNTIFLGINRQTKPKMGKPVQQYERIIKKIQSFYNIIKSIYALDGKIETPNKSLRKTCEMAQFPRQLALVRCCCYTVCLHQSLLSLSSAIQGCLPELVLLRLLLQNSLSHTSSPPLSECNCVLSTN